MKRNLAVLLAAAMLAALLLTGCGGKSVLNVSSNEDNTVSITAEQAEKGSAGVGYLTVGENETALVETAFEKKGTVALRIFAGLLGSEDFPDTPVLETTVSGEDSVELDLEPGEYSIGVVVEQTVTGTAVIRTQPSEPAETIEPAVSSEPVEPTGTIESSDPAEAEEVIDTAGKEETASLSSGETDSPEPTVAESTEVQEDPAEDDGQYSIVTAMGKAEVEAFAADVKQAYLAQDWETISTMIRYPITLYPDVRVQDAEEFLVYMEGKTVHESDAAAMEEETCEDLFANGQGICLGSGQVWLLDTHYMEDAPPQLQIIALSGIVEIDP